MKFTWATYCDGLLRYVYYKTQITNGVLLVILSIVTDITTGRNANYLSDYMSIYIIVENNVWTFAEEMFYLLISLEENRTLLNLTGTFRLHCFEIFTNMLLFRSFENFTLGYRFYLKSVLLSLLRRCWLCDQTCSLFYTQ